MIPPRASGNAQGATSKANQERRRELENILSHSLPIFRRIALRRLRNTEDAEDAVQDAMLLAVRHIMQFDGRSQMVTWLTSIVINAVRTQLRRRNRAQLLSLEQAGEQGTWAISEMLADPSPTPEQILEQRELRELAASLTSTLSPTQRTALRLSQREGITIKKMAQLLRAPEGTVKARLARGRTQLMQRFEAVMALKPQ